MITAPMNTPTTPAAAFVPVSLTVDTVSAGPDGATGERMRGEQCMSIDLRPAGTADIRPSSMQVTSTRADGSTVVDWNVNFQVSPAERAAATALAQAFEGSNMLSKSVPFTPGEVADGDSRLVMEDAAGTKLMFTAPTEAPDHPGDATLKAALNAYIEAAGQPVPASA